jgi:NADH-quinone oxidoreductase subunit N
VTWPDLVGLSPILILALGSVFVLIAGVFTPGRKRLLAAGVIIALAAATCAAWYTPPVAEVGGMFGTGPYARFFTVLWALVGALTLLVSIRYGEERRFGGGEYTSLVLFGVAGMALLSSATSLVGFFVSLEAFTLALYVLIAFDREEALGAEAGLKYLILGAAATGFVAFGIALVYTSAGTFHLPEAMAGLTRGSSLRAFGLVGWSLILVMIGFKVSLVPFHLWTPDVYQGAPAPVTGLLSTGSKGAVFAALIPLLAGLSAAHRDLVPVLWMLSALSMLVGTFCALRQQNVKRMLAYSSVAHMGYVLMALVAGGIAGRTSAVFYLVVYAAMNLGAFAVIASFADHRGEPQTLEDYRHAAYRHPFRAAALTVFLLSLAGIPPTAGFMAKLGVFSAAIRSGYVALAVLGILASVISLYYYLQVVIAMFMTEKRETGLARAGASEQAVLTVCLGVVLWLGVYPGPLLSLISHIVP